MLVRRAPDLKWRDVTPEPLYLRRREFLAAVPFALGAAGAALSGDEALAQGSGQKLEAAKSQYSTTETPTPFKDVTTYNNFYEFGTDKGDPAQNAHTLQDRARGRSTIDGAVGEGRQVRHRRPAQAVPARGARSTGMRCVEGWSMVIPWIGFPLGDLLKRVEPTAKAKFVEFTTLHRSEADAGRQRRRCSTGRMSKACGWTRRCIRWRSSRVGLYGEALPNQNGAPMRLVVPWKYGFKSIKSIVRIRFVEQAAARRRGTSRAPQRVRLLLEREPGGRSSALEPGDASGASASSSSARR